MYTWQQAGGKRHARRSGSRSELPANETFTSLCGETLTVGTGDVHRPGGAGWLDPTCFACDVEMRKLLGIDTVPTPRTKTAATIEIFPAPTRPKVEA